MNRERKNLEDWWQQASIKKGTKKQGKNIIKLSKKSSSNNVPENRDSASSKIKRLINLRTQKKQPKSNQHSQKIHLRGRLLLQSLRVITFFKGRF